jgi:hypothetical protein
LQDFKLIGGDQVGEILCELPIPDGETIENIVRDRMANHYETRQAQAVRAIEQETGKEIYRWTWWDEDNLRAQRSRETREALRRRKETPDDA